MKEPASLTSSEALTNPYKEHLDNLPTENFTERLSDAPAPEEEDKEVGFWKGFEAASYRDNTLNSLKDILYDNHIPMDSEWNYLEIEDKKDLGELKERHDALPLEYREEFGESYSAEHLEMMVAKAEKELEADKTLSKSGILPRLAYNIVDPVSLGLTLASGGTATALKVGATSSRAINGLQIGALSAAENVALEGMLRAGQQNKDPNSMLYAGLGGFVLGGALGSVLSPAVKDKVADGINQNLSAAKNLTGIKGAEEVIPDAPEKFGAKATLGFNRLYLSASDSVKNLANKLFDGVPNKDDVARDITAEASASLIQNRVSTAFHRGIEAPFKEWAKENGYGAFRATFGTKPGAEFREQVTLALRDVNGTQEVSKQAREAAKSVADVYNQIGQRAKEVGLKGFEDFTPNPNYVPRIFNGEKLRAFVTKHDADAFDDLVEAGIRQGGLGDELKAFYKTADELDTAVRLIAKGYSKKLRFAKAGAEMSTVRGLDLDDIALLKEVIGDEAADIFKKIKQSNRANQGKISRAKRRLTLDETATITRNGETIRFDSLLENDIGKVTDRYVQVMSGWIGAAERMGVKSQADWQRHLDGIIAEQANYGDSVAKDAKQLDEAFNLLIGNPIDVDPFSVTAQAGRFMRDVNFPLMMGQSGFAQVAELGNIIANSGFSALVKAVPDMGKLFKRARDGKLEDDLAEEIEFLWGTGTLTLRNRPMSNFDEFGNGYVNKSLQAVDPAVQSAKKFVSVASGLTPVTDLFQRISARSFLYRLTKEAEKGKPSKAFKARLMDAGLSEDDVGKVFQHLKTKTVKKNGKLKSINYDKWDADVLDKFQVAVHRINRRVIQENDIGSSHPFLHKELGKILFQFRGFVLNAWVKQTLHGVRFADRQLGVQALSSMTLAALAYTAQQSINNASDSEKLKERLKPSQIAAAAFHRAGLFSVTPALADNFYSLGTGGGTLSPGARSSGLAQSGIASNPTVATLGRLTDTVTLPLRLTQDDYDFSQENVKNLQGLTTNLIMVNNAWTPLYKDLPKKSRKNKKNDSFFEQVFDD